MAAASLFADLLRQARPRNPSVTILRAFPLSLRQPSRPLSSGLANSQGLAVEEEPAALVDDLRSRIFRLRLPKRSAMDALDRWVGEGRTVTASELREITKDLRKSKRFKHALEILTWMESNGCFQLSPSDHGAKLDLLTKVYTIAEAETYFQKLSSSASKRAAAFPLLHSYVKAKDLQKSEALMYMLQNSGLVVDPHPFNEMMKLYMATGQIQSVIKVIQYMKRSKIPLNVLSYNLWMNACGMLYGIMSAERMLMEMTNDKNVEVGWSTYCTLANIYTNAGNHKKAHDALALAEEMLSTRKRLGYYFIMTIYASLNNKDGILRMWQTSEKVPGRITCTDYMTVILCLVKVGDIKAAEKMFQTWESQCRNYDIRVSNVLLGAYMRNGWMDKAESLHLHTLEKGGRPNYKTWEILMEGWVKTRQMDRAVEAMKKGFSLLKGCQWRPPVAIVMSIAEYFEENGNVDESKWLFKVLRGLGLTTLPLYKLFLRTHIRAGQVVPDILRMMGQDQIDLDEEILSFIDRMSSVKTVNDDCI
ncbi:pentatricopeptide repeat-containing protein At5g27460-like isoform X1 [Zingiber officinale]|uniref:pentatricopeptide repeat-containing protein At5g27460-like isoform X1 n=1 Tax=Zingiber officinale TaxID=94328 RepID=UPI001C4D04B6|nr:pentatricopeptide repeat-containing protein At5g27460-like isoform X1 [Zingiber officinale]